MTHANSITFDLAWYTILSQYSASVRRTVCDAVLNFALTGEVPVLKGIAKVAFQFISHEISKQLGKETVESIPVPVPSSTVPEAPEGDADDMAQIQQHESFTEPVRHEPMLSEDEVVEETPDAQPEETMPEAVVQDICDKDISYLNIKHSKKPQSASPESQPYKPQGCLSRNRMPVGKICCIKKGSKMLFRRR